ncbi:serine hydrolase domain-containing protein [Amycolatopsis rubida]|uniref:Beta-lactamase n=1 Tax=Amycolatopsis rubida TaxID=112413 RepID=A0A1I5QIQ5_9PSEU|nr:serine hydrolase domain-containing protein [Amycolatopsis rubida]SFP46194.1 Beta-lactamase [Amycolatopsis rubida]
MVREEFETASGGVQLAVRVPGRPVVDLWAGEVTEETLTGMYSSTRGATTLVVALLVLDLDELVARQWSEFAAAGKGGITVRDVLTHRSGVIGADGGLSAEEAADDRVIARRLAGQRPGSACGYSGFAGLSVVAEAVRRVTGRSVQEHFETRIREPYGLDRYLGRPRAGWYREVLPGEASAEELASPGLRSEPVQSGRPATGSIRRRRWIR